MKKIICIMLAVILTAALAACGEPKAQQPETQQPETQKPEAQQSEGEKDLVQISKQITEKLSRSEYDEIAGFMGDQMKTLSAKDWEKIWDETESGFGAFQKTGEFTQFETDGYDVVELELICENGTAIQRTVFDSQGLVAGFFMKAGPIKSDLPEGITEQEITFDSQPGFPIYGTLTMPKEAPKAALVLVHGSGPQDRDSTIGFNKPFRDLAYGLAAQGIAVLRYDKVTYTYGEKLTEKYGSAFTVEEESILDAVSAVNWLKQKDSIPGDSIYVLGMSLGGSLLSSIGKECPDVAGYISMSGTPLPLWKISLQQNEMSLEEQNEAQRAAGQAIIDEEVQKAENISDYTEEELTDMTVFGLPGIYSRHLFSIKPAELHLADKKPILILQGGKDRQVTPENGIAAWQTALAGHPDATYKLYDDLNHIMGDYQGEAVPFLELLSVEYRQNTPVPQYVIDDIADWMNARGNH